MENPLKDNYNFVDPKKAVFYNRFIEGSFAKDFMREMNKLVELDYKNHDALKTCKINDGYLSNFNMYSSIIAEKILNETGFRGIRFGDVNDFLDSNSKQANMSDILMGVVYRGIGHPRPLYSQHIASQLRERDIEIYNKMDTFSPVVIPLSELEIAFDPSFKSGLCLELKKDGEPILSKSLKHQRSSRDFYEFGEFGPDFSANPGRKKRRIQYNPTECGLSKIVLSNSSRLITSGGKFEMVHPASKHPIIEKI